MIEVENITFSYPLQKPIFEDFSWTVNVGETWIVLGPSGCGKSTLLYLLSGLKFPSKGKININSAPLLRPRPHTGLIIQDYGLLPWATVKQNVELGNKIRDFYGPDGTHAPEYFVGTTSISYWLERLDLITHAHKFPGQLSGGQRQRTAIARTLALEPDLILMDEPFSSLDAPTRDKLHTLTHSIQKEQGLTLIIVTHSIEEAAILGNNILVLGHPPNINPTIQLNPQAGEDGYRDSLDYQKTVKTLRILLEEYQVDKKE